VDWILCFWCKDNCSSAHKIRVNPVASHPKHISELNIHLSVITAPIPGT
jgi:hypothetical protein